MNSIPDLPDGNPSERRRLVPSLLEKVRDLVVSRRLLLPGDRVLLGLSGGLDSMVLLDCLAGLRRELEFELAVAHCNHGLRGEQSDGDEEFARKAAERLELPFFAGRFDVAGRAKQEGVSLEMAARECRHRFLAETARTHRCNRLALAHHADDQTETFLIRLLRGAGGSGAGGMKWLSPSVADPGIAIVRPLLDVRRTDLANHATANGVAFREDSSNAASGCIRNRIRNELLPAMRGICPSVDSSVARTIEILRVENDWVRECAERWLKHRSDPFVELHAAVQRQVVLIQLHRLGVDPEFRFVEFLRSNPGVARTLPDDLPVLMQADGALVVLERPVPPEENRNQTEFCLARGPSNLEFGGLTLTWERISGTAGCEVSRLPENREMFDREKVGEHVTLRFWQAGDRFQPLGMPEPVKLQDWFTNLKIPRAERHRRVLAESQKAGIFWVEGCRIAETAKITPETRELLRWEWHRAKVSRAGAGQGGRTA